MQALGNSSGTSSLWFQDGCGTATFMEEWHSMPYTNQHTTINSIKNGILDITTSNLVDAQIDMSNLFTAEINTSIYKNIAIRYKVLSGSAGQSEIYFYKGNLALAENKVVRGNLISDNNWHVLNIDMSANPNWNNTGGNIKGWRFDYATGQSVNMLIDYITLTDRAVLENTNDDDSKITVYPVATTNYFALRSAESPCTLLTTCQTITIYRGKTWNGGPTGDWSVATNWIPVGVPASDDCIEVGSSLTMAITGSHAVGKTLNVTGGNFTINSGSSITLKEALTVASGATFTLEDSASLVQEGATNTNSGAIIVKRTAKPMKRFDYTYWSSPVANQSLHAFSPTTFFDKFHSWNPGSGTQAGYWQVHPSNGASVPMAAGKGYIVRAPQSFPVATVNSENFVGNFNGVPNSGDIQIAIAGNSNASVQKWNLIGNPYPSALNIDDFFNDSFNTSNIYGTIYLWTHNTPISANNSGTSDLNYAASDYASYNGVGGTATSAATQNPLNPVINPSPNNAVPNGFIASGQSFFIRGKSNTNVRFTNAMRVRNNNNQFFRIGNVENQSTSVEKNRFWLNLRNTQGAFHQTLVGYVSGATNDLDDNFDGELFGGNFVSIYSVLADKKMTIQGKAVPFENTDAVQLGITTTIAGNFSISLDNFDGLFESQDILLKDNLLNLVHNLKTGGYEFTSGIGTFNDRFEIVYQSETLGNNTPDFNSNTILIYKNDKTIVVNSGISTISNVQVFDIQGRLLLNQKNVNTSETILKNLPFSNQVLIVKVQTLEGNLVSKKIIY
ncbi:T9SS sorting signal type C domain-containing protein [Flavobacterium macacae]|uniref:T9SS C-terminal target domain-containing protein n=1 Tax=Flavobacterium macacae TaxID=2488993 RepID=A0A3P3WBL9_9FLAO|nr:T9SS sorting signal type C domain-containing protein [Flavobacterium macacae]RRJ92565.1 T9SS C-terminal target domain-containing protein [Flavobacterium macacae]